MLPKSLRKEIDLFQKNLVLTPRRLFDSPKFSRDSLQIFPEFRISEIKKNTNSRLPSKLLGLLCAPKRKHSLVLTPLRLHDPRSRGTLRRGSFCVGVVKKGAQKEGKLKRKSHMNTPCGRSLGVREVFKANENLIFTRKEAARENPFRKIMKLSNLKKTKKSLFDVGLPFKALVKKNNFVYSTPQKNFPKSEKTEILQQEKVSLKKPKDKGKITKNKKSLNSPLLGKRQMDWVFEYDLKDPQIFSTDNSDPGMVYNPNVVCYPKRPESSFLDSLLCTPKINQKSMKTLNKKNNRIFKELFFSDSKVKSKNFDLFDLNKKTNLR